MRRLFVMIVLLPVVAHAYPLLAPRPVPNAIAGPADPHLAASFYNPAALGPLRGFHFWTEGSPRFHLGNIDRGAAGSASINYTDFDAFIGASWDGGTDTVTFAITTMVPYSDLASYGDSPVRYHSTDQLFIDYQQTVAVALKVSSRFFIGVSANFMESWMRWRFARDAGLASGQCTDPSCFEDPGAREQVRLRGFGAGWNFAVGVLGRATDRLWLGLSYTSHTFSYRVRDEITVEDERGVRVTGPGVVCVDGSGRGVPCEGNASLQLYVPDLVQAAARVEVSSRVDLEATLRWVHYGGRSRLDLRTQGGTLGQLPPSLALPPQSRRDLGLQDTFGAEVSARFRVGEKLRLMPSLFFETSAVEASAVSAAALDAPKLDLSLTAEWRPIKRLVLGAHVGLTGYILHEVDSRHKPEDTVACVQARYSLDACGAVVSGAGLPSASGRYTLFTVHLGAAIGIDY